MNWAPLLFFTLAIINGFKKDIVYTRMKFRDKFVYIGRNHIWYDTKKPHYFSSKACNFD